MLAGAHGGLAQGGCENRSPSCRRFIKCSQELKVLSDMSGAVCSLGHGDSLGGVTVQRDSALTGELLPEVKLLRAARRPRLALLVGAAC